MNVQGYESVINFLRSGALSAVLFTGVLPAHAEPWKVATIETTSGEFSIVAEAPATLISGGSPVTLDSSLNPIEAEGLRPLMAGSWSSDLVAGLRHDHLAYVKDRRLYAINLASGTHRPRQVSTISDACRVEDVLSNFQNAQNSWLFVRRAGIDGGCLTSDDEFSLIRLGLTSSAAPVNIGNLLSADAVHDSAGSIVGFITVEGGGHPVIRRRNGSLGAPATLLSLATTDVQRKVVPGRALFIKAQRAGQTKARLWRYDIAADSGVLTQGLYVFAGKGVVAKASADADWLYFGDRNKLLRIPLDATSGAEVAILARANSAVSLNRVVASDGLRVVFVATNMFFNTGSGIYAAEKSATGSLPTLLRRFDKQSLPELVALSRDVAYVTVANRSTNRITALRISVDGTLLESVPSAYWSGFTSPATLATWQATSSDGSPQYVVRARRTAATDALELVSAVSGEVLRQLGQIGRVSVRRGAAVLTSGIGQYASSLALRSLSRSATVANAYIVDLVGGVMRAVGVSGQREAVPLSASAFTPVVGYDHTRYWLAPHPRMPVTRPDSPDQGSVDFMTLFSSPALWAEPARRLDVFKLYGEWIAYNASDDDLRQVINVLKSRGLALAVEAGPLDATAECGHGVESFAGESEGRLIAQRIINAGGAIDVLALDEPFFYGSIYDGPNACHFDAASIAEKVAHYITVMREYFPNVAVGDTEAISGAASASAYRDWLETFRAVNQFDLAFLHADIDWYRQNWSDEVASLEDYGREFGVPIGIIYTGDSGDIDDESWIGHAGLRARQHELSTQARPSDVLFQSWNDKPDFSLPAANQYSLTGLVAAYFRDIASTGPRTQGAGALLSLHSSTSASQTAPDSPSQFAVDGDLATSWSAGAGSPQWIDVDLGSVQTVERIRMTVAQYPSGSTTHSVYVGTSPSTLSLEKTLTGITADGDVLEYAPPRPVPNVRYIRIETTSSPSWVAWREISVYGRGLPP